MDPIQKTFLGASIMCLIVAFMRVQVERFNRARVRNVSTLSIDVECDVQDAREGVRQLTADIERMNAQLLEADRRIMGLKVKTMQAREDQRRPKQGGNTNPAPTYARPPAPPAPPPVPAKKKSAKR